MKRIKTTNDFRYCAAHFFDLHILSFAIILWIHAQAFAKKVNAVTLTTQIFCSHDQTLLEKSIRQDKSKHWPCIFEAFKAVQNASELINSVLGSVVFWYLAEGLIHYSIELNLVFTFTHWFSVLGSGLYFSNLVIILYCSVSICAKVLYMISITILYDFTCGSFKILFRWEQYIHG